MAINRKAVILQVKYIYNTQKFKGVVLYFLKVFNYLVINRIFFGSNSQKGEDLAIDTFFKHKKKGFYIDIGAYHPKRYNNTKFFYDKGWHGINIEPNPNNIKLFQKDRTRDVNLNIGIGGKTGKMAFYVFKSEALSTFSKKELDELIRAGYRVKNRITIQVDTLKNVMRKYVRSRIDFMTVDTEGLDIEVLRSNDWKKYRPTLLCVETIDFVDQLSGMKDINNRKVSIGQYLKSVGYKELFTNGLNTVFEDVHNIH